LGRTLRLREGNKVRTTTEAKAERPITLPAGKSLLNVDLGDYIKDWQFLSLWPQAMGNPTPQTRTKGRIRLAKDGSNIAEVLRNIGDLDRTAFNGIVETLRAVLPYAEDVQPAVTSEIERTVYLQLTERDFKVPGWLLSSGTLRILALLALLRHPEPPPLVAIEEIENGLDPGTVHLLVEEIRAAVEAGRTQLVVTTHSPYLLDLLPLSAIVLVDRVDNEPRFARPADSDEVQQWAKNFAPGQLYTMNRLHQGGKP
jgi:predicted ATPase